MTGIAPGAKRSAAAMAHDRVLRDGALAAFSVWNASRFLFFIMCPSSLPAFRIVYQQVRISRCAARTASAACLFDALQVFCLMSIFLQCDLKLALALRKHLRMVLKTKSERCLTFCSYGNGFDAHTQKSTESISNMVSLCLKDSVFMLLG